MKEVRKTKTENPEMEAEFWRAGSYVTILLEAETIPCQRRLPCIHIFFEFRKFKYLILLGNLSTKRAPQRLNLIKMRYINTK